MTGTLQLGAQPVNSVGKGLWMTLIAVAVIVLAIYFFMMYVEGVRGA